MNEEAIKALAMEFGHLGWDETSETFDTVDVVFSGCELVGLMIDANVTVTLGDQAIVGELDVGVHITFSDTWPEVTGYHS